jgi:hypothetical protein
MLAIHAIATWRARPADVGQLLVRSRCLHGVAVSCCVTCHAAEVPTDFGQSRQSQFGGAPFHRWNSKQMPIGLDILRDDMNLILVQIHTNKLHNNITHQS